MKIEITKVRMDAIGAKRNGNAKPVFCITNGAVYASVTDAANEASVSVPTMCQTISGKSRTCRGKRYCYVSDVMMHLDEISENLKIRNEKIAAYDAIIGREEAQRKAQEKYEKQKAKREKLLAELAKTEELMKEAEKELQ